MSTENNMSTEKFQTLWMSLIRYIRDTEEKEEKEEKYNKLQESLREVERLIDDGADINKPFGDDGEYREKYFRTPLYYLMEEYYYSGTKYMNSEFLDEILSFLFSKNVVIDKNSIILSNDDRDPKLFEEFLMRSDDNVQFEYKTRSLLLEIMIGFPSVRLDECIPYEFSYTSKEDNCLYFENYPYLPIERVLLDYATERGLAITTDDERRDIIRILKRQGSPSPCRERINIMFYKMEEKKDRDYNDRVKERFQEAIDYWEKV